MRQEPITPLQVKPRKAAAMLDVSLSHFYEKILDRDGGVRSIGRGRLRRIPVAELERYIAERMRQEYGEAAG